MSWAAMALARGRALRGACGGGCAGRRACLSGTRGAMLLHVFVRGASGEIFWGVREDAAPVTRAAARVSGALALAGDEREVSRPGARGRPLAGLLRPPGRERCGGAGGDRGPALILREAAAECRAAMLAADPVASACTTSMIISSRTPA